LYERYHHNVFKKNWSTGVSGWRGNKAAVVGEWTEPKFGGKNEDLYDLNTGGRTNKDSWGMLKLGRAIYPHS